MIPFFIIMLSYLLEVTLKYYLPFLTDFYMYLQPMFFVSFLIIYIIIYNKNKDSFYFVIGNCLIYDLFFGNVLFLYTLIFLILYHIIIFILKRISNYMFVDIIMFILGLVLFLILKYIILLWTGYHFSIIFLLDQVVQSIIINIIYGLILYYFLGIKLRKT